MDTLAARQFDRYGFLLDPSSWSEELAQALAQADGLAPLDARRLEVLRTMRRCYERTGAPPAWHHVCHLSGFSPDCLTRLFPSAREAWRLAGLPYPGEEALAYL